MYSYTIDVLSDEWVRNTLISLLVIVLYLWIGKGRSREFNTRLAEWTAMLLAISFVAENLRYVFNGNWMMINNLPLQLCSISRLLCIFVLFVPKRQFLFELLFFFGFVGGIQSILTPQINHYDGGMFHYIEYYFSHIVIISVPIFMYLHLGYRLRKRAWWYSFLVLNTLILVVMPINFLIGSNYMYLNERPLVNNPLIIGEWPYYLVVLEFVAIGLFYLTYRLFLLTKVKQRS